jgi:hypothetical protein
MILNTSRRTSRWRIVIGILIATFSVSLCRELSTNYSYDSDEIFSIVAGRVQSWPSLFQDWILPDTFPPLYPILLKLWISVFGTMESATRSLSTIFCVLSLIAIAWLTDHKSRATQLLTLLYFGSSPFLAWSAQHVRAYALMIFLSTLLTGAGLALSFTDTSTVSIRRKGLAITFYISGFLLGLTHYFGWLYVAILAARNILTGSIDKNRSRSFLLLAAISVWPLFHYLSGSFSDKSVRISWITPNPIAGVFNAFINAAAPVSPEISFPWAPSPTYPWSLMFYGIFLLGFIYACGSINAILRPFKRDTGGPRNIPCLESLFLLTNIMAFLLLVMLIDLRMPLGVDRYFTVLLPPVAFLFGNVPSMLFPRQTDLQKTMTTIALFTVIAIQLVKSNMAMVDKSEPTMNFKQLSTFIHETNVCSQGCWRLDTKFFFHDALAKAPYFDGISLRKTELNDDLDLTGKLPFLGFHDQVDLARKLQARNPAAQCWEPREGRKSWTFIFLDKTSDQSPKQHGLSRCRN